MIGFVAGMFLLMAFIGAQATIKWTKKKLEVFKNERR